jgi:hypothetical protein
MTTETRVPTDLTHDGAYDGIALTTTTPADTVKFVPAGNRDFIVLKSTTGTITGTVACVSSCSMGVNTPTHDFVMSVGSGLTKAFVIPYLEHYKNLSDGTVSIVINTKANAEIGIFRMPAPE